MSLKTVKEKETDQVRYTLVVYYSYTELTTCYNSISKVNISIRSFGVYVLALKALTADF